MELAPSFRARLHREQAADCLTLAVKANAPRSIALLIDTAIEQRLCARRLEQQARGR